MFYIVYETHKTKSFLHEKWSFIATEQPVANNQIELSNSVIKLVLVKINRYGIEKA